MHLHCFGLSHHTAPLDLREKIVFSQEQAKTFFHRELSTRQADEIAIISTCNRVEIYFSAATPEFDGMIEDLAAVSNVKSQVIREHSYRLRDQEVVRHLFRVAAGLDSLVIGESQILGQVSQAYEFARARQAAGPQLSKLFQAAIFSAKRVQSETKLGRFSSSVPSLAVKLASRQGLPMEQAHVLLLGAGAMAELAVEALRKRGVHQFSVVSRTLHSAAKLAKRWKGRAGTLNQLSEYVQTADVLLCSSSSRDFLINKEMIDRVMSNRPQRPLTIMDIAVPRNIHPDVRQVQNVSLYDLEDLQRGLEISQSGRASELPKAEQIVEEQALAFSAYLSSLDAIPVIRSLREQAENIRQNELQKTLQRLPGLDHSQRKQISALTHSIVGKLLHNPTAVLRLRAASENGDQVADIARQLFGLDRE